MTWVEDPALARIWAVLRQRVEERGLRAEGRVRLTGLTRAERHAVAALVGRPVTTSAVTVDLAGLAAELSRGAGGLLTVLEATTGGPLVDRPRRRAERTAARDAPPALARSLLAGEPWLEEWLDGVRRAGVLSRTGDPEAAVRCAAAVLARVPASISRTELAAAVGADAHALDDGTAAAALVLRALAVRAGESPPTTPATRRGLWERYGVRTDLVSTTCLTLGLHGTGTLGARLAVAADAGDPVHVTAWDLRRGSVVASAPVLVCENPRVLESIDERHGGRIAVVCTSGRPALVVLDVLRALTGSRLRYHGDFDWPGLAMANRLVDQVGVVPWRMSVDDYLGAVDRARLPLAGAAVEAGWDAELGPAMRSGGVAVHEEAVLDDLLAALPTAI